MLTTECYTVTPRGAKSASFNNGELKEDFKKRFVCLIDKT